jgi:general stress protein 26
MLMSVSGDSLNEKLWSLIKHLRFPIMISSSFDRELLSRPVAMQNQDSRRLDFLWIFTRRDCAQVEHLQWDSSVSLVFCDPATAARVTVFGSAAVVEDPVRKRALWTPAAASWFPGGPEDPTLALVRVRIIEAHFWDLESSSGSRIFKLDTSPLSHALPSTWGSASAMRH